MLEVFNANCTVQELYKMFEKYGSCQVNCVRGVALVSYDKEDCAVRAMKAYNNYTLHKKRLDVRMYKGGPVGHDYGKMEVQEPQLEGMQNSKIDRVDFQALLRIRSLKTTIEEVVLKKTELLKENLKNTVEGMVRDQMTDQEQKVKIGNFLEVLERQSKRVTQSISGNLDRLVKRVASFDAAPIDLQNAPGQKRPSLLSTSSYPVSFLEPSKPYFDTFSFPAKRLLKINDSNFICAFGGQNYCRYYNINDIKPRFGQKMDLAPSSMALYTSPHHHYSLIGDRCGSISIVKLDPFGKAVDSFAIHKQLVTDIKQYQNNQFMSCSTDSFVRCWKVIEEQRMKNDYCLVIQKTDEYPVLGGIATMDILNENQIVLGLTQQKILVMPLQKGKQPQVFNQMSAALKVLKHSQKQFWASVNTQIKLIDCQSRSEALVFDKFGDKLRPLVKISQNYLCFGGQGRVGLLDRRNNKEPVWKEDKVHDNEVRDLLNFGNTVISCGLDRRIVKWYVR